MDFEVIDETKNDIDPPKKKARLWSAKEFRNNIKNKNKVEAIQHFFQLCSNVDKKKYITEYLQQGGCLMELFQLLGSDTPAVMLLEIVNNVLLHLIASGKHDASVYDPCRYFLQTHLASINKMISLGSPRKERKVILKILTSIVTFSKKLAKEILLHVNFNSVNVEVLTKQSDEDDSVRNAYIHFVMSFFVEGEYSIIFVLLDKKYMLLSIFRALQYDLPETVALVMNTLRTYLLETNVINKTTKMGVFNTNIVKDIVNLYNWKGPRKNQNEMVDLEEKSLVTVAVHHFLLVLCTSHKYGVIFRDPQLGLGKKSSNSLIYTVVESLERPWEHSYASELVTKICGSSPDLTKTMWDNLKTYLEPRSTERWFKAMNYAIILVKELQPSNIEYCIGTLSVGQLSQAIPSLVAPQSILKTIIPENRAYEEPLVKLHCVSLLVQFAKAVQSYCSVAQNHLNVQDYQILKHSLNEYFYRNFLTAQELLDNWTKSDDTSYSTTGYLQTVLDLLDLYETLCPQLLESITAATLPVLLRDIDNIPGDTNLIKIRVIKLFLNFDSSMLDVNSEMFKFSFSLALKNYYKEKDPSSHYLLKLLLKNVGIFEDCVEEIDVWINSFLELSQVDDVCSEFIEIIRHTSNNILSYISVIQKLTDDLKTSESSHCHDLIESLLQAPFDSESSLPIKNIGISPLLFGVFDTLENGERNKHFKTFLNSILINLLHLQTFPTLLIKLVHDKQHLVSKPVFSYLIGWSNGESTILAKTKLRSIENFNVCFLTGDVDTFFEEVLDRKPLEYLHQALFYFTQLNENLLNVGHLDNCVRVCKRVPQDSLSLVFGHPILIRRFSPTQSTITNRFLAEIINCFNNEVCLKPYRSKLTASLQMILKKRKARCIMENLETFGVDYYQCVYLLELFSKSDVSAMDNEFLLVYYDLVVYLLKRYLVQVDFQQLLSDAVVVSISRLITCFNTNQFDSSACTELFQKLLENFPHAISVIPTELLVSIFNKNDFCKQSAVFAAFLIKHRKDFLLVFKQHIDVVVKVKGLILPLLESAISVNVEDEILGKIYKQFEPSILKGLEKPNKAGPYFEKYKDVLVDLITRFMSRDRCLSFALKVHKFDTTEVFHVQALATIFTKVLDEDKYLHNTIITLAYATNQLFKKRNKSDDDWLKLAGIVQASTSYYEKLKSKEVSYRTVCENEVFNLYYNYCLKHGLSGKSEFLRTVNILTTLLDFSEDEARNLLVMTGSHSEFLEIALGSESECKQELFKLILVFCERWPVLLQRNHMPVLLSSYQGTMGTADRTILTLLQIYEKKSEQTHFYDFKPFLWGKAAATHYSVRQDIQTALWRQPRMLEILEILEEAKINNTICNHPLNLTLTNSNSEAVLSNENVYNLSFFLPLFGSLLVTENQVALHTFVKSGALSLTILGLSCNNKRIRLASCHVLSRLHYHFEAKRSGKDKILRLCFIESLCRGLAALEDFKLNNFCSIFWARMALILIHPLHRMYIPLSRYLTAKPTPDLSGIPELYTFLHIPDVNFKEPRAFILKILQDGMRTNADCSLLIFKMGFKLLLELFSSCISDLDTKISILKITERACCLDLGKEMLCTKYGLLSWLYDVVTVWGREEGIVQLVISILIRLTEDVSKIVNVNIIILIITMIIDDGFLSCISKSQGFDNFLKVVNSVFEANNEWLTIDQLKVLISVNEDVHCTYLLKYGSQFSICNKEDNLLRSLVKKWLNKT
ncbi:hypothetical protein RN001_013529 [Aquatica leii]|uniref:Nucleolar pre-ribosomal-associated protein 1 n=1 Tax=Aquatica leii TaxID=1421715 RepID=A0AAN7SDY8_9COLE|nr:hypothetical protein RN001_013529 [Aquatica leii]